MGLFFILFFCCSRSIGAPIDTLLVCKKVFSSIVETPAKDRVKSAYHLYRDSLGLRKASPATAMTAIDELVAIARGLKDKVLECSTFDMRADYYSVNKGFNNLTINYYNDAVAFAAANKLYADQGFYLHREGQYFAIFKHNEEACRYFLRAQSLFEQAGYDNVADISILFSQAGDFYYALGDYENARTNLEQALKCRMDRAHDKVNVLNTIGLIYRNYKQYPRAVSYFEQAEDVAAATKDTAWIGITRGNIGSVYFLQNQYGKALPYVKEDYQTSIKYHQVGNATIALLRLVKMDIDQNDLPHAKSLLDTADVLFTKDLFDVLPVRTNYYDLKAQLAEKLGQPLEAVICRKKYEAGKDSLTKRDNIAAVERVKLRYEIDRHNAEVNQLKSDARLQSVKIKAAILVLALLLGIAGLWYNNQRIKARRDKELLMAEKRRVDEELKNAEKALKDFTENLRQKNALIEKFKGQIEKLKVLSSGNNDAGQLEELLQAHIMTDESWQEFRKLFSKVYPGFFVSLSKEHPMLSATDTRILALLKLGLSNSEMANMLGITVEGIQKAKQRLRKKMDITAIAGIGAGLDTD